MSPGWTLIALPASTRYLDELSTRMSVWNLCSCCLLAFPTPLSRSPILAGQVLCYRTHYLDALALPSAHELTLRRNTQLEIRKSLLIVAS